MIRKSFYVITNKSKYGGDFPLLWFEDLDSALDVFRLLINSKTVRVEDEIVPLINPTEKYKTSEDLHYIVEESGEFKIENRHLDIYERKEIEKIKKEREANLEK